jgi:hypothetical protein
VWRWAGFLAVAVVGVVVGSLATLAWQRRAPDPVPNGGPDNLDGERHAVEQISSRHGVRLLLEDGHAVELRAFRKDDADLRGLAQLPHLRVVELENCHVGADTLRALSGLTRLAVLTLKRFQKFSRPWERREETPARGLFAHLQFSPLQVLDIQDNDLAPADFAPLAKIGTLKTIVFDWPSGDESGECLRNLRGLPLIKIRIGVPENDWNAPGLARPLQQRLFPKCDFDFFTTWRHGFFRQRRRRMALVAICPCGTGFRLGGAVYPRTVACHNCGARAVLNGPTELGAGVGWRVGDFEEGGEPIDTSRDQAPATSAPTPLSGGAKPSWRARVTPAVAALCVALFLAAYFGYQSYQRARVESARRVLLSPLSDYSETKQAIDEIAKAGSAGRYALFELLRHGKLAPGNDNFWNEKLDIFRKLGPDAAPAIIDLLLCLDVDADGKVRSTLDAIDSNWRDRPEVPAVAARYLARASKVSHNNMREPAATSEERMDAAVALHRLVGNDRGRARRIIAGNANRLIPHLVEHYKGPYPDRYYATVRFLLEVLDPNWEQGEAARQAYPYLLRHLFDWRVKIDDASWIDARDWVVKRVPADVLLGACLSPTKPYSGLSDTALDLVCQYPQPVRQRLVSACLQHGGWMYPGSQAGQMLDVRRELRNLSRLDPGWHQNAHAVNAIPVLMKRAVCEPDEERNEAFGSLEKISPKWFLHPNGKLMVPFLVEQVSPRSPGMSEMLGSSVQSVPLDRLIRAGDMLTRLGPNAREAIPRLLVIRAKGIPAEVRPYRRKEAERIDPLFARFPDVIDANWPDAPESLLAIPELIALLDNRSAAAAELLGRFGPVARCALPALQKALGEPTKLQPEAITAFKLAISKIAPQARPSEHK